MYIIALIAPSRTNMNSIDKKVTSASQLRQTVNHSNDVATSYSVNQKHVKHVFSVESGARPYMYIICIQPDMGCRRGYRAGSMGSGK